MRAARARALAAVRREYALGARRNPPRRARYPFASGCGRRLARRSERRADAIGKKDISQLARKNDRCAWDLRRALYYTPLRVHNETNIVFSACLFISFSLSFSFYFSLLPFLSISPRSTGHVENRSSRSLPISSQHPSPFRFPACSTTPVSGNH